MSEIIQLVGWIWARNVIQVHGPTARAGGSAQEAEANAQVLEFFSGSCPPLRCRDGKPVGRLTSGAARSAKLAMTFG